MMVKGHYFERSDSPRWSFGEAGKQGSAKAGSYWRSQKGSAKAGSYFMGTLLSVILLCALGYVLELNSIQEANAGIKEGKKRIKELRLEYQTSLRHSPFGSEPQELEWLREEFSLEGVGGFTLLEPSKTQFSLNPRLYE